MRLLILVTLVSFGADWTVNPPEVVGKKLVQVRGQLISTVRVVFTDDTTPDPKTQPFDYQLTGADSLDTLKDRAYRDRATLQGHESIPLGPFEPTAPAPADTAIQAMNDAARQIRGLNVLQELTGTDDSAEAGNSEITGTQVRNSLISDLTEDMTNATRLAVGLRNLR
jgi:hypothetical protein